MTDQEALAQQLQAMIRKAQRALRAAEQHLTSGDPDFANIARQATTGINSASKPQRQFLM